MESPINALAIARKFLRKQLDTEKHNPFKQRFKDFLTVSKKEQRFSKHQTRI